MKDVPFDAIGASSWDALAEASPQAWLLHRSDWISIETEFFWAANLSFALVEGGRLVGIQPLYLSDARHGTGGEVLIHSGIHRHTGLALAPDLTPSIARAGRSLAMVRILELAAAAGADRILLNSHNLAPENRSLSRQEIPFWVLDYGFHLGLAFSQSGPTPCPGLSTCNADQIVDLSADESQLFAQLDSACRRAIRKAEAAGLSFSIGGDAWRVSAYMRMAEKSAERTGEVLPPAAYYRSIIERLGSTGRAVIAFSQAHHCPVAGLVLLIDKNCATFLAGVSEPDALELRPNDHVHWQAMLWAKHQGLTCYRLGPSFPEVPDEWPISRVSRFKTKFGAKAVPVIQGSLFLKPDRYIEAARARLNSLAMVGAATHHKPRSSPASTNAEFVAHHLRLFGLVGAGTRPESAAPFVVDATRPEAAILARAVTARGGAVVALSPSESFAKSFGATIAPGEESGPSILTLIEGGSAPFARLRTLYPTVTFSGANMEPVVRDQSGRSAWSWARSGSGGLLVVGTDLSADLLRYRQGDPRQAAIRPSEPVWGIPDERPIYLYEEQLAGEAANERHADWWCKALTDALVRYGGLKAAPLLPGDAPGAIVVTGDDDQAALSDYAAQRALLGDLPITYFLHPLTKHDRASLAKFSKGRRVEWALHPDALHAPQRYAALFDEQMRWFETLTGDGARSLRNHGFLNDGYWGHLPAWLAGGVIGSTNLPGLDGRVLNGSLLPARMLWDGRLTDHWSILTAIGDGVVFIQGKEGPAAGEVVRQFGRELRQSGVPGVIVVNLHPANVAQTTDMHVAAVDLVQAGFVAWTFSEMIDWFCGRDAPDAYRAGQGPTAPKGFGGDRPLAWIRRARRFAGRVLSIRR